MVGAGDCWAKRGVAVRDIDKTRTARLMGWASADSWGVHLSWADYTPHKTEGEEPRRGDIAGPPTRCRHDDIDTESLLFASWISSWVPGRLFCELRTGR